MATSSPQPVADTALDSVGLSVTVAHRRANDSRYGTLYDTATLAAALPVYFHPLKSGEYMVLFSRRWHSATVSASNPSSYTSYTEDTSPGWVKVAVPSGHRTQVGDGFGIPLSLPHDSATLIDAASTGAVTLFLLFATTTGSQTTGAVASWHYNTTTGSFTPVAEEGIANVATMPPTTTDRAWVAMTADDRLASGIPVSFTGGLQLLNQHMLVIGTDPDNNLYLARKPWARIGVNNISQPVSAYGITQGTAEDPRWVYWTGTGWSPDWYQIAPLRSDTGEVITSLAPVSLTSYRNRTWMATVQAEGTQRSARVYSQRGSRAWSIEGTLPLGEDTGFLDGVRFQPQVAPSTLSTEMAGQTNESALVYLYSTFSSMDGVATLNNTWGLWPVGLSIPAVTPESPTALNTAIPVIATFSADAL